jgi:hypothetical protein
LPRPSLCFVLPHALLHISMARLFCARYRRHKGGFSKYEPVYVVWSDGDVTLKPGYTKRMRSRLDSSERCSISPFHLASIHCLMIATCINEKLHVTQCNDVARERLSTYESLTHCENKATRVCEGVTCCSHGYCPREMLKVVIRVQCIVVRRASTSNDRVCLSIVLTS